MIKLDMLQDWIFEAGKIALSYAKKIIPEHKEDHSLVTEADRAVEAFLVNKIETTYPTHKIIAEEGTRTKGEEYSWVIDPIDGTLAFVLGIPTWCISIGVLHNTQPYLGMVYMPITQDLYKGYNDGTALWNGHPIHTSSPTLSEDKIMCISPRSYSQYNIPYSGGICSFISGIFHNCLVARGVAISSLTLTPSIWDLAGVYPILNASGAILRYLSGESVDLSLLMSGQKVSQPIISGHPDIVSKLLKRLSPKGEGLKIE